MNAFKEFEQRFECRTGLKLVLIETKREGYREYWATSNGFKLFRVGSSIDEGRTIIGMVSQPEMYQLDPESSASYRRIEK